MGAGAVGIAYLPAEQIQATCRSSVSSKYQLKCSTVCRLDHEGLGRTSI